MLADSLLKPSIQNDFTIYKVNKENNIRDFVESKTRRPYRKGEAFYQLNKTETVQGYKEILVLDRTTGNIYGGEDARDLIGIPDNGQDVKVVPGLLGSFDVFLQSTSVNRKVFPGTSVLVQN